MSLDVYLTLETPQEQRFTSGIFIREDGGIKEITRAEWDERFPGREPNIVRQVDEDSNEIYWANITHNLNQMAGEAGIYEHLWRPDELGITRASGLVAPLTTGLALLKEKPERFTPFNPKNGWGTYAGLVNFVEHYLKACKEYPNATVSVSR